MIYARPGDTGTGGLMEIHWIIGTELFVFMLEETEGLKGLLLRDGGPGIEAFYFFLTR